MAIGQPLGGHWPAIGRRPAIGRPVAGYRPARSLAADWLAIGYQLAIQRSSIGRLSAAQWLASGTAAHAWRIRVKSAQTFVFFMKKRVFL